MIPAATRIMTLAAITNCVRQRNCRRSAMVRVMPATKETNCQGKRWAGNRIVPVNQACEKSHDVQQQRGNPRQGDGEKFPHGGNDESA
jgi:hypothetical protein